MQTYFSSFGPLNFKENRRKQPWLPIAAMPHALAPKCAGYLCSGYATLSQFCAKPGLPAVLGTFKPNRL